MAFLLKHVAEVGGAESIFRVEEVAPLGLRAMQEVLHAQREHHPTAAWGYACDGHGIASGKRVRLDFQVDFKKDISFYGLVSGGALPPPFLLPQPTLLLDRNIVSALLEPPDSKRPRASGKSWVFSLLDRPGTTVNPLFASFEGCHGRLPSFTEFSDDIEATVAAVAIKLPNATLTHFDENDLRQMHKFRSEFELRGEREARFLQRVSPLLVDTPGQSKIAELEREVLSYAEAEQLRPTLAVIATLTALYEDPSSSYGRFGQPARQVLKLSANYSERDTYNALADLRQLELLACSDAFIPRAALLTEDQWMSLVWCGLQIQGAAIGARSSRIDFRIDPDLWPRLPAERRPAIMERLRGLERNASPRGSS